MRGCWNRPSSLAWKVLLDPERAAEGLLGVCVCVLGGGAGRGGRKLQIDMTVVLERGSQVSDNETQVRSKFGSRTETRRDESRTPRKS